MDRNECRRLSAEEKLKVVEEGRQSGATISEVCRRHQVDHAQFYRWERLTRQGALKALRNGTRKSRNGKHDVTYERGQPPACRGYRAYCGKPDSERGVLV